MSISCSIESRILSKRKTKWCDPILAVFSIFFNTLKLFHSLFICLWFCFYGRTQATAGDRRVAVTAIQIIGLSRTYFSRTCSKKKRTQLAFIFIQKQKLSSYWKWPRQMRNECVEIKKNIINKIQTRVLQWNIILSCWHIFHCTMRIFSLFSLSLHAQCDLFVYFVCECA